MNAQKAVEQVKNSYGVISRKKAESVTYDRMEVNQCHWQGDVAIIRIAGVPAGCTEVKPEAQLAPGTTKGSRHILASLEGVEMYRLSNPTPLDGPIMVLKKGGEVTHPEHGNVVLLENEATYHIRYQRAYAEELRRVED